MHRKTLDFPCLMIYCTIGKPITFWKPIDLFKNNNEKHLPLSNDTSQDVNVSQ